MGMTGAANGGAEGRRGEYVRITEEVEVVKEALRTECPRVLRWRAILWWAKVAVLEIFLAGAAAAAVVFLGPLVLKKMRRFTDLVDTNYILDAIRGSEILEVQGNNVRRRNDWSEWLLH